MFRSGVRGVGCAEFRAGEAAQPRGTGRASQANVGWGGFGNTPDENRYSPLTLINQGNVSSLGRLFTVDFQPFDPTIRLGEQSYPVEQNGTLYMTTNDDNVWALNATTGAVKWRWTPSDVAVSQRLRHRRQPRRRLLRRPCLPADARHEHRLARPGDRRSSSGGADLGQAVPGATVELRLLRDERPDLRRPPPDPRRRRLRVRRARLRDGLPHDNLTPAWPNPFWTIPPKGTEWRRLDPLAGGGVVWTPATVDPTTDTLYFGTGSRDAAVLPVAPPGLRSPRPTRSIAVNLKTGTAGLVAAAAVVQRVVLRHLAAAARLHRQDRRQERAGRLGRDDGGRLVRLRRADRAPDLPAGQGARQHRAPGPQAGQAGRRLPVVARRVQLLAGLLRPETDYVYNAAAETASVETAGDADPTQKKDQFTLGDVFLGLRNGDFGAYDPGLARLRLDQRDQRRHRQGRLEGRHAAARARRRHDHGIAVSASPAAATASCAPSTPRPARSSGRSRPATRSPPARRSTRSTARSTSRSRSAARRPPRAAARATQLQVFALGGSTQQSTAPVIPAPGGKRAQATRAGHDRTGGRPPLAQAGGTSATS